MSLDWRTRAQSTTGSRSPSIRQHGPADRLPITSVNLPPLTSSAARATTKPELLPVAKSPPSTSFFHKPPLNPKSGEGGQVCFLGLICSSRFRIYLIYNRLRTFDSFNLKETEPPFRDKETPFCGLLRVCFTFLAVALFIVLQPSRPSSRPIPARLRQHNRAGRVLML